MNSFLEWLFEAKMKNTHEFEAHNRMYLKNVITSILKNKIVDVGDVESNFIGVDKSVIISSIVRFVLPPTFAFLYRTQLNLGVEE